MRNRLLLLLGVVACGKPAASAVPADVKEVKSTAGSDEERRRTEDAVTAWVTKTFRDWEKGDSAALMDTYLPEGPIFSVTDGEIVTTRDSVAQFLTGLSQTTGRKTTFQKPVVDVLAPGVAVATVRFQLEGTKPGQKEPFVSRGVWTGAVAQQSDGRLRIIQEHQSSVSASKK